MSTREPLDGKEFEHHCIQRMDWEHQRHHCLMGRYGVQGTFIDGKWQPMQSLPDFEGVLPPNGRQFIFDAKVCSQASFDMAKFRPGQKENKARQLDHLLKRATYGAICFFLIHWNARQLKTKSEPEITWAFPVHPAHPFWERFCAGETTSINRLDCDEYAVPVPWNAPQGCRVERPDILHAVTVLAHGHPAIVLSA